MKLKKILAVAGSLALSVAMLSISPVYAAEKSIEVGAPVDIYEGTENAGKYLAFPINIQPDENGVDGIVFHFAFDKNALTLGVEENNAPEDIYDILEGLYVKSSGDIISKGDDGVGYTDIFVITLGTTSRNKFTPITGYQWSDDKGYDFAFSWADANQIAIYPEDPEFYLLFTVKDGSKLSNLNNGIITLMKDSYLNGLKNPTDNFDKDASNSCAGAFQVKIDGTKVPADTWIRNVYAQQDGHYKIELLALEGEGDTGTYIFPVRVQLGEESSAASATFNITATVTTTKNGSDESTVNLGSVEVPLSGTVNSYETNSLNATVTK